MIIAGAKGFAKELLQVYYRDYSKSNIFFFDDASNDIGDKVYGKFPIIRTQIELVKNLKRNRKFALGVGTPRARKTLWDLFINLGGTPISIISERASIGSFETTISQACSIVDGVTITNDIVIGKGTLINLNCTIGHDSVIGAFCDISPGVNISGHCIIGNYTSIGTGAALIPGVKLGDNVIVGAGSVITKDIPSNSVCVGVPGRVIKKIVPFNI